MPKREPTPPLEDDSKFLIINYPFPLHANMTIEKERVELAHWIASCIGQDNLTAIYYKPSAPNMVIIEVMKDCPRLNALLGVHKWREFLRRPNPDQAKMESRIYYCRFSTGREVQKHGWRRIDVWDSWFKNYDPSNGPFVTDPYPRAGFCEVPPETQTDYGLCRPLPIDLFPRPRPSQKRSIVPGSDKYVNIKEAGQQSIVAPSPTKQTGMSWASLLSADTVRRLVVELPRTTSKTSSTSSTSVASPIDPGTDRHRANKIISPPPGLSPPGLSEDFSQASSEWDFEPTSSLVTPHDSSIKVDIITSGLEAAAINDYEKQMSNRDKESSGEMGRLQEENFWTELPTHPVDWDKLICPEHNVACRAGICKVMDEMMKKKKREAQGAARQKQRQESTNGNGNDGWEVAKAKGRGRGRGQGWTRGQGKGRGSQGRKGGWC
ncbi:hypothetical protein ACEPAG_3231 [Sanghuangporus baumii]